MKTPEAATQTPAPDTTHRWQLPKKLLCWSRTLILKGSSCDETQRPLQTVAEEDEGAEGRGVNIDHHFINYSNGKFRARRAVEGEQEGGAETSIFGFARNLS